MKTNRNINRALTSGRRQLLMFVGAILLLAMLPVGAAVVNYTTQTGGFTATTQDNNSPPYAGFYNNTASQLGVYANSGSGGVGQNPQAVGYYKLTTDGNQASAAQALRVGQQLSVTLGLKSGGITGNSIGLCLNNGTDFSGANKYNTGGRFEYSFTGGDSSAAVYDSLGKQVTGLPGFNAFSNGLTYTITLVSKDEYNFQVSGGGATYNVNKLGGTAGAAIDSLSIFNRGYANGDALFNSISITDVTNLTYTANAGETKYVTGVISDNGGITNTVTKLGVGAVVFQAANTYGGSTTISNGLLIVTNGGSINTPLATLNIAPAASLPATNTLLAGGSITVASLIATNNGTTYTNSFFNFSGGTLVTSNNNKLAANILISSNSVFNINGNWQMKAGTNITGSVQTNAASAWAQIFIGNTVGNCAVAVNSNATWIVGNPALPMTNGSPLLVGFGSAGTNNNLTINGGTLVITNLSYQYLGLGNSSGNGWNQMIVTNGGRIDARYQGSAGNPIILVGAASGSFSNTMVVAGTNGAGAKSTVNVGGDRFYIGNSSASSTNNWVRVDQGGQITNIASLITWNYNNNLFITNGGLMALGLLKNGAYCGRQGTSNFWYIMGADAAGNRATFDLGVKPLYIGGSGGLGSANAGSNNFVWIGAGGMFTNAAIQVGAETNAAANGLIITNGGQFFVGTSGNSIGTYSNANNNFIAIGGNNAFLNMSNTSLTIGNHASALNNSLTLLPGGSLTNFNQVLFGGSNSTLNFNGGTLFAGGSGTMINTNPALSPVNWNLIVQAGGAIINDSGLSVTFPLQLIHDPALGAALDGGLTKNGAGTLNLGGIFTNTYTGLTTVNAGTLAFSSAAATTNAIGGDLLINPGATVNYNTARDEQIPDSAKITNNSGTISFGPRVETWNTLVNLGGTNLVSTGAPTIQGGGYSTNGYFNCTSSGIFQFSNNFTVYNGTFDITYTNTSTAGYRFLGPDNTGLIISSNATVATLFTNQGNASSGARFLFGPSSSQATNANFTSVLNVQDIPGVDPDLNIGLKMTLSSGFTGFIRKDGNGKMAVSIPTSSSFNPSNFIVNQGTVAIMGGGTLYYTPLIQINNGAILDFSGVTGGTYGLTNSQTFKGSGTIAGTLTNGNSLIVPGDLGANGALTISGSLDNSGGRAALAFDIGGPTRATPADSGVNKYDFIGVGGNLVLGGSLVISNINGYVPNATDAFVIITNGGTLSGNFTNVNSGGWVTVANDSSHAYQVVQTPNSVYLTNYAVINPLAWAVGSGAWDIGVTANWKNGANTGLSFNNGYDVVFDDTSSGVSPILITNSAAVSPASVTNNSTKNYTIYGSAIAGSSGLTKLGSGTLTLAGTNNFTGITTIGAGTLQLGDGISRNGAISGNAAIINNAALAYAQMNNQNVSNFVSGSGSVASTGSATLTVAPTQTRSVSSAAGPTSVITMASTAGLSVGQSISVANTAGSGMTSGAYIASVDSATQITISGSATNLASTTATITGSTYFGGSTISAGTLNPTVSSTVVGTTITNGALGVGPVTLGTGVTFTGGSSLIWYAPKLTLSGDINLSGGNRIRVGFSAVDLGGGSPRKVNATGKWLGIVPGILPGTSMTTNNQTDTGFAFTETTSRSIWEFGNNVGSTTFTNGDLSIENTTYSGTTNAAIMFSSGSGFANFPNNNGVSVGGNVVLLVNNSFNSASSPRLTINTGGYVDALNADLTVFSLAGAGTYCLSLVSNAAPAANTLTLAGTNGSTEFSGSLQNGPGTNGVAKPLAVAKTGASTQIFSGINYNSGPTTISAGALIGATGGSSSNSAFTVVSGATNGIQLRGANGQWFCAALTNRLGSTLDFNLNNIAASTTVAPLQVLGDLAITNAAVSVRNSATALTIGDYPLIRFGGALSGALPASATVTPALATGLSATITNTGNTIYLRIVAATATVIGSSLNPSVYGDSVTFTASVQTNGVTAGDAGGSVTFNLNGTPVATNPVTSGQATFTTTALNAGAQNITANFNGDIYYQPSASSNLVQTVNKAVAVVTLSDLSPTYDGTAKNVSSSTTPGGLTVVLDYAGSPNPPTNAGTYQVIGTVVDANYDGSATNNLVINPAALGITANNASKAFGVTLTFAGTEFTTSGLVAGDSVTSVTLTSAGATNNAVPGSYAIVPSAAIGIGLGNYTINYTNGTLTVTPAMVSLSLTSSANPAGYLDSLTFTATLPGDADGNIVFASTNGPISTNTLTGGSATSSAVSTLPRGTNLITAVYSGGTNYLGTTNSLLQVVTNHPPVAALAAYYRGTVATWKIRLTDLATNVFDADGDSQSITAGTSTNGATLAISGGILLYSNPNIVNDQITYQADDGFGGITNGIVNLVAQAFSTGQNTTVTVSGSTATVDFAGIPGYSYTIERTTNLVNWASIWTTNAPATGAFGYTDDFSDLGVVPGSAYYRLRYNP